jgi:hypothetical protein
MILLLKSLLLHNEHKPSQTAIPAPAEVALPPQTHNYLFRKNRGKWLTYERFLRQLAQSIDLKTDVFYSLNFDVAFQYSPATSPQLCRPREGRKMGLTSSRS